MRTTQFGRKSQREIDRNVAKRQALKKKWDKHCKYSAGEEEQLAGVNSMFSHEKEVNLSESNENWVRMLDEGVVVDGDGYCYAVIQKGTLKEYFDNIPDDFEGYIDRDHVKAIRLGEYTKKDMRLVSTGDGRHGIDINVKLNDDYYATRDLMKLGEHRAVSVEMMIGFDTFGLADKITGDKKQGSYLVPIINKVDIMGYAVCENPKNANSIKDGLLDKASVEGDTMDDEELKKLAAEDEQEAEQAEDKSEEATDEADTSVNEEGFEAENDANEEADTEGEADAEATAGEADAEASEEEGEAESEDSKEASEDETKADDQAETEAGLEQLGEAITQLRAEIAEKDKKIAELENQLAAKANAKMSNTERIAELLNLAKGADRSEAEGSKVDTPSNYSADNKYAEDDAAWDEAAEAYKY